jgi:hypothetical protein
MTKAAELAKMGEVLTNSQIGGRRNIVINGAMQVAQRGTTSGLTSANDYYGPDRFRFQLNDLGTWEVSQSTESPEEEGFNNSLKLNCTTADTSVAAGSYLILQQRIEGFNAQQLKFGTSSAESMTFSFWIKSVKTGLVSIEFQHQNTSGTYYKKGATFTINTTNTWEKKIITVTGNTAQDIKDGAVDGLYITFWFTAGSTYTGGTHNITTWASTPTNSRVSSSGVNFADSTSNEIYLTGLQLEVGEVATPFEHLSVGETERLCHRYFQKLGGVSYHPFAIVAGQNTTLSRSVQHLLTPMRAIPTFATEGSHLVEGTSAQNVTSFSIDIATKEVMMLNINSSTTHGEDGSAGRWFGDSGTSARISFDAEL